MPDTHTIAHPIRHPRRRLSAYLAGRSSAALTTRSPPPHHLRTSRSLAEPDGLLHPAKSLVTKSRGKSLAASCRRTSRKVCKSRRMSFWHHTHSPSSRHRRTFGSLAELDGLLAFPTKSRANSRAKMSMRGRGRSASLGERSVAARSPTPSHLPKFESFADGHRHTPCCHLRSLRVGTPRFTPPRTVNVTRFDDAKFESVSVATLAPLL